MICVLIQPNTDQHANQTVPASMETVAIQLTAMENVYKVHVNQVGLEKTVTEQSSIVEMDQ